MYLYWYDIYDFPWQTFHNARSYATALKTALDMLHAEVPRMLVQIVAMFDVSPVRLIADSMSCDFLHV